MNSNDFYHKPVLLDEVIGFLNLKPGMVIIDCTVGLGGHSQRIIEKIQPGGTLVGFDRDSETLKLAEERLKGKEVKTIFVHDNFSNLNEACMSIGLNSVDAFLFDLGVSSYQIDTPERGFSFLNDAELDMRFDPSGDVTAADIVNNASEHELANIIYEFGEERFSRRIAKAIVNRRNVARINSTLELAETIKAAVPPAYRRGRIHPATRTFQALRIAVNDELNSITKGLKAAKELLSVGGRIGVISFHSLEDRLVKRMFRSWKANNEFDILTKKPIRPTDEEVESNPRARSSKFRVCEKVSQN